MEYKSSKRESEMGNNVWRGFLSFGMLSIPVCLKTAARDQKVELHTYHSVCKSGMKKPSYCATCEKVNVPKEEIIRGYDTGDGIVPISDEELEAITPATEHVMEISECVALEQVDPIYLAESFYLLPDAKAGAAANKPYSLLVRTLTDTKRCAIAQLTKTQREHIVLLRPKGNGLVLHYLFYASEVHREPEFENLTMASLQPNEIKACTQLIESMENDFDPASYSDQYFQRLNTLIASKLDDKIAAPVPVKGVTKTVTVDLMSALTASLANVKPRRHISVDETPVAKGKSKKKKVA
jgi:DNA end-binding protein Ku